MVNPINRTSSNSNIEFHLSKKTSVSRELVEAALNLVANETSFPKKKYKFSVDNGLDRRLLFVEITPALNSKSEIQAELISFDDIHDCPSLATFHAHLNSLPKISISEKPLQIQKQVKPAALANQDKTEPKKTSAPKKELSSNRDLNNNNEKSIPYPKQESNKKAPPLPSLSDSTYAINWNEQLQSCFNASKTGSNWLKELKSNLLFSPAKSLNTLFQFDLDSVFKFDSVFKIPGQKTTNPIFEKIVGWAILAQKVLEKTDTQEKLKLIESLQLGKALSQCAKALSNIKQELIDEVWVFLSEQINLSAIKVLETMAHDYFFNTEECKEAILGPHSTKTLISPDLKNAIETALEHDDSMNSHNFIAALDERHQRIFLAKSRRPWYVSPFEKESWKTARQQFRSAYPDAPVFFTRIDMDAITNQILFYLLRVYAQFCNERPDLVDPIVDRNDSNQICGSFCNIIQQVLEVSTDAKASKKFISIVAQFFPQALPQKKWDQLFDLCEKDKFSAKDLLAIIYKGKITDDQLTMMALAYLPCGEVKIALDYCRNFSKDSKDSHQSLRDTLTFLPLQFKKDPSQTTLMQIGEYELTHLEICNNCHSKWPIFEALKWAIDKSGLHLPAFQDLDREKRKWENKESF